MASNRSDVVYGNRVLVREKIPYTGKGVESLIKFLRQVLDENPYTQKMVVQVGKPVYIEKLVPKEEAAETQIIDFLSAARQQPMVEYMPEPKTLSPTQQLFEMFNRVDQEDLEVCQVLIGSPKILHEWASLPRKATRLFGVPFEQVDLPEDVILVCGAEQRLALPEDILFSVKGVMA